MNNIILIASFSNLHQDPRVRRQINHLRNRFAITTLGLSASGYADIPHILIFKNSSFFSKVIDAVLLFFRLYSLYLFKSGRRIINKLQESEDNIWSLVIANDKEMLFLSSYFRRRGIPLLYDAHEYTPKENENSMIWRILFKGYYSWLCRKYLPEAQRVTTVSQGIAEEYYREFGIEKPEIITNAPAYHNLSDFIKNRSDRRMNLLYHGGVVSDRKIINIIKAVIPLEETHTLTLMLVGPSKKGKAYIDRLKKYSATSSNIFFREPVPQDKIIEVCTEYDAGIIFYEPVNFNIMHCLPNKFFEYIQARIPVIISPLEELSSIVREYNIGLITDDYAVGSLTESLKKLTHQKINELKQNMDVAALELSGEKNMIKLEMIVDELIGERGD